MEFQDGFFVPERPDGMAAFDLPNGDIALIKNHEIMAEITPLSIKKNIDAIIDHIAEQDHVTVEIEETKQLVGSDLNKYIFSLEKKMLEYATKLEFEDAAKIRDEINRLKSKQVGIPKKVIGLKN